MPSRGAPPDGGIPRTQMAYAVLGWSPLTVRRNEAAEPTRSLCQLAGGLRPCGRHRSSYSSWADESSERQLTGSSSGRAPALSRVGAGSEASARPPPPPPRGLRLPGGGAPPNILAWGTRVARGVSARAAVAAVRVRARAHQPGFFVRRHTLAVLSPLELLRLAMASRSPDPDLARHATKRTSRQNDSACQRRDSTW